MDIMEAMATEPDVDSHSEHSDTSESSDDSEPELVTGERNPAMPPFKKELADALLEQVRVPGRFAGCRPFEENSPGFESAVTVDGVGSIRLPLEETQAQEIIARADEAEANIWELGPNRFLLNGENDWTLNSIAMEDVSSVLGFHDPFLLRPVPDKMLLLGKGAHVKEQNQLTTSPHMCGKLALLLVSEHEGGDIIARHDGKTVTMSTQLINTPEKKNGLSFYAWYTGVQYEITPVTAGYLWVVTYDLIQRPFAQRQCLPLTVPQPVSNERLTKAMKAWLVETERKAAADKALAISNADEANAARDALHALRDTFIKDLLKDTSPASPELMTAVTKATARWTKKKNKAYDAAVAAKLPQDAVFCLSSQYDRENPSLAKLDDRDRNAVQALLDATADLPVDVFLCNLRLDELGVCEQSFALFRRISRLKKKWKFPQGLALNTGKDMFHPIDEILQYDYQIEGMYDMEGRQLAKNIPLEGNCIVYENFIDGLESQTSFHAGSEATATHTHKIGGVIIVPRHALLRLLCTSFLEVHKPGDLELQEAEHELRQSNLDTLLQYYALKAYHNAYDNDNTYDNPHHLHVVKSLCLHVWQEEDHLTKIIDEEVDRWLPRFTLPHVQKTEATLVLAAMMCVRDWAFFDKTVAYIEGDFDPFFLLSVLAKELNPGASGKKKPLVLAEVKSSLTNALISVKNVKTVINEVSSFCAVILENGGVPMEVEAWRDEVYESLLRNLSSGSHLDIGFKDAHVLFDWIVGDAKSECLKPKYLTRFEELAHHTAFSLGILDRITHHASIADSAEICQRWWGMYRQLAAKTIRAMDACRLLSSTSTVKLMCRMASSQYIIDKEKQLAQLKRDAVTCVEPDWLVSLYNHVLDTKDPEMVNVATEMLSTIAKALAHLLKDEDTPRDKAQSAAKHLWLPFAKALYQAITDKDASAFQDTTRADLQPLRDLAAGAVNNLLYFGAPVYPKRDGSLHRRSMPPCPMTRAKNSRGRRRGPLKQCRCNVCDAVNDFLEDFYKETLVIALTREHRVFVERETKLFATNGCSVTKIKPSTKGYKMETIRLEKTWEADDIWYRNWATGRKAAEADILAILPRDTLKALLTTADYQRIARMDCLKAPSTVQPLFGEAWADLGERPVEATDGTDDEDGPDNDSGGVPESWAANLEKCKAAMLAREAAIEAKLSAAAAPAAAPAQGAKRKAGNSLVRAAKK